MSSEWGSIFITTIEVGTYAFPGDTGGDNSAIHSSLQEMPKSSGNIRQKDHLGFHSFPVGQDLVSEAGDLIDFSSPLPNQGWELNEGGSELCPHIVLHKGLKTFVSYNIWLTAVRSDSCNCIGQLELTTGSL
jgi:hypothetical protein